MEDRLYLKELPCYKASPWYSDEGYFDFSKFPTETIKEQARAFLLYRASHCAHSTLATDRIAIKELAEFYAATYPGLADVKAIPLEEQERQLRKFLLSQGKQVFREEQSFQRDAYVRSRRSLILLRKWMEYASDDPEVPEEEKDSWHLERFSFFIRRNPLKKSQVISFTKIPDGKMKEEIKRACFLRLHYGSVSTVYNLKVAGTYLVEFLLQYHPEITSLTALTREILEEYFLYLRTEIQKMSLRAISSLKGLLTDIGNTYDCRYLPALILASDYPRAPSHVFRSYSKEDLEKMHKAFADFPEQLARALAIHELLGTRISDTLTLKQDCLKMSDGTWFVRIDQPKTNVSFSKPVSETTARLIEASIRYTTERYGKRKYVFVMARDPDRPMPYSLIYDAMRQALRKHDVRDKDGNPIQAETHLFRHTYGQRLTEVDVDDIVIAKLLGHRSPMSVWHYRKMSSKAMAEQTRNMRERMDEKLKSIVKEWADEEV